MSLTRIQIFSKGISAGTDLAFPPSPLRGLAGISSNMLSYLKVFASFFEIVAVVVVAVVVLYVKNRKTAQQNSRVRQVGCFVTLHQL